MCNPPHKTHLKYYATKPNYAHIASRWKMHMERKIVVTQISCDFAAQHIHTSIDLVINRTSFAHEFIVLSILLASLFLLFCSWGEMTSFCRRRRWTHIVSGNGRGGCEMLASKAAMQMRFSDNGHCGNGHNWCGSFYGLFIVWIWCLVWSGGIYLVIQWYSCRLKHGISKSNWDQNSINAVWEGRSDAYIILNKLRLNITFKDY